MYPRISIIRYLRVIGTSKIPTNSQAQIRLAYPEEQDPAKAGPTDVEFEDLDTDIITNMFRDGAVWVNNGWMPRREAVAIDRDKSRIDHVQLDFLGDIDIEGY